MDFGTPKLISFYIRGRSFTFCRVAWKKSEKAVEINERLKKAIPNPRVELDYSNALELLVATILAAQCTDVKVNEVGRTIFKKYRKPEDYLKISLEDLEEDIHPTGFFRQKAKNIRGAMEILLAKHDGLVPDNMANLVALPGVGRKTANVILGNINGIPGIVVDTHMTRVSNRLGLTLEKDAVKVEKALGKLLAPPEWILFSQIMVLHGRYVCKARRPLCDECSLVDLCPYFATEIAPQLS
jgi:endonuclease-3